MCWTVLLWGPWRTLLYKAQCTFAEVASKKGSCANIAGNFRDVYLFPICSGLVLGLQVQNTTLWQCIYSRTLPYSVNTATVFWFEQILSQSFSYLKTPFNTATLLIWPDFCGLLVTGLMVFHCVCILYYCHVKKISGVTEFCPISVIYQCMYNLTATQLQK